MSKYGTIAVRAAKRVREENGLCPISAWKTSAEDIFPEQKASQEKGCPRNAFLGLAEEGLIRGVPPGRYTRSLDNKDYALEAVKLLRISPDLSDDPKQLWECVMHGRNKQHNGQMDVAIALWKNGDIGLYSVD